LFIGYFVVRESHSNYQFKRENLCQNAYVGYVHILGVYLMVALTIIGHVKRHGMDDWRKGYYHFALNWHGNS